MEVLIIKDNKKVMDLKYQKDMIVRKNIWKICVLKDQKKLNIR